MLDLPDGSKLLVSGPVDYGSDAAYGGTLAVVDGCLGLDAGDVMDVVVWPDGTTADDGDEPAIVLPGGEEIALGDEVSGGGGEVSADDLPEEAPELPDSCSEVGEVAVLAEVEAP